MVSVLDSGRRRAWVQIAVATLSGKSLRQTVYTHYASVHQAAKLVTALLRVVRVTAGLAAYRRVYDSRYQQADCQEPRSAPKPYARQSSMGYVTSVRPVSHWNSRRQKAIQQSISFAFLLQQLLGAFFHVLLHVARVLFHHLHDRIQDVDSVSENTSLPATSCPEFHPDNPLAISGLTPASDSSATNSAVE